VEEEDADWECGEGGEEVEKRKIKTANKTLEKEKGL
jgi:hypothetical protein